jgi:hypothetical protein
MPIMLPKYSCVKLNVYVSEGLNNNFSTFPTEFLFGLILAEQETPTLEIV